MGPPEPFKNVVSLCVAICACMGQTASLPENTLTEERGQQSGGVGGRTKALTDLNLRLQQKPEVELPLDYKLTRFPFC